MISQSHCRPRSLGLAGWWVAVVLGVLGSFMAQVAVRAGHHHESRVHEVTERLDRKAGSGCGHHHHDDDDNPADPQDDDDEDSPCDVCLKLTLAAFTSIVGGSAVGLVLPWVEVVAVEGDEPRSMPSVTVWRAMSRGPPTLT